MAPERRLRYALVLQAISLAFVIAVPLWLVGDALIGRLIGSCTNPPCDAASVIVLGQVAFLFGGPLWWAVAGAKRAGGLATRQLGWLVVVDIYLVAIGLAFAVLNRQTTSPGLRSVFLSAFLAVIFAAVISFAACAARLFELREGSRLPM